jgi:hypothetical protein
MSGIAITLVLSALGAAPAAPASVDEIVRRHVEARGGHERIKAIRTLVFSRGQYREPGYVGSGGAFMAFARPFYRVVGNPEDPNRDFLEGYDGSAWEWYGDPGVVVRTVGAAAGAARRGADFEGPFVDWREKGVRIERGPDVQIGGRPAYQLVATLRDGFQRAYFIDRETFLIVADRYTAPVHAFGAAVATESRFSDYREVAGVLFAHRATEVEIATGKELSSMTWGAIEANRELPRGWWSPPEFARTPLQQFLENLYFERSDVAAVEWTYREFRRAHPGTDTDLGVGFIGYQMLKMGDHRGAVTLLEMNAADHPGSASAAFGLGRAYHTVGDAGRARGEYERALRLDPQHKHAAQALRALP